MLDAIDHFFIFQLIDYQRKRNKLLTVFVGVSFSKKVICNAENFLTLFIYYLQNEMHDYLSFLVANDTKQSRLSQIGFRVEDIRYTLGFIKRDCLKQLSIPLKDHYLRGQSIYSISWVTLG